MTNRAWVTLATNDSYSLGALVLAHSLRRAGTEYPSVVLITPSVTDAMRERLSAVFAEVITVDVLDSRDAAHLALLQRPELGITFTKIHCWNLTQYEKCVFLDADTLVVQNCDELFEREELSAAPDVGWPDCFNSGVFVFKPSADTFSRLITFAKERGSFDGGDQGLLNSFFSDWAHGDISKHLPFLYNVTSAAFYSYIPALKHYGQNLKIIHFIGAAKPWLQQYNWDSNSVDAPDHIRGLLQLWWDIFVGQVHTQLDITMVEVEEEPQEAPPAMPPQDLQYYYAPKLDPESEFPWHHPEAQIPKDIESENKLDPAQFYDPWEHYRGSMHDPSHQNWSEPEPITNVWEHQQPGYDSHSEQAYQHYDQPQYDERQSQNPGPSHWHTNQHDSYDSHSHEHHYHSHTEQSHHHSSEHYQDNQEVQIQSYSDYTHSEFQHVHDSHDHDYSQHDHSSEHEQRASTPQPPSEPCSHKTDHNHLNQPPSESYTTYLAHLKQRRPQYVYCIHLDHSKPRKSRKPLQRVEMTITPEMMSDHDVFETESEHFDDVIPRHPYDGFYLRHKVTVDSRGKKVCTHEIPPDPSPPASPPPDRLLPSDTPELLLKEDHEASDEETPPSKVAADQTGVAGNLARVVPGAASQGAVDELTRRQGWEAGNIDYMGADSFDNIWAKISQTLNQPRTSPPRQSPPKQPSPPKEQPAPEVEPSKEPAAPAVEPAPVASSESKTEVSPPSAAPETPKEDKKGEVDQTPVESKPVVVSPVKAEALAPIAVAVESAPAPPAPVSPAAAAPAPVDPVAVAPVESAPVAPAPIVAAAVEPTPVVAAPVEPAPTAAAPVVPPAAAPVEPASPAAPEPKKTPAPTEPPKETPVEPAKVVETQAPAEPEKPKPIEKAAEAVEVPVVPKSEAKVESAPKPAEATPKKTEITSVPPTPPVTPVKSTPEASTPVSEEAPKLESQVEKSVEVTASLTDSPPLANTPSKEEAPVVSAAKSTEEAAQETRL